MVLAFTILSIASTQPWGTGVPGICGRNILEPVKTYFIADMLDSRSTEGGPRQINK